MSGVEKDQSSPITVQVDPLNTSSNIATTSSTASTSAVVQPPPSSVIEATEGNIANATLSSSSTPKSATQLSTEAAPSLIIYKKTTRSGKVRKEIKINRTTTKNKVTKSKKPRVDFQSSLIMTSTTTLPTASITSSTPSVNSLASSVSNLSIQTSANNNIQRLQFLPTSNLFTHVCSSSTMMGPQQNNSINFASNIGNNNASQQSAFSATSYGSVRNNTSNAGYVNFSSANNNVHTHASGFSSNNMIFNSSSSNRITSAPPITSHTVFQTPYSQPITQPTSVFSSQSSTPFIPTSNFQPQNSSNILYSSVPNYNNNYSQNNSQNFVYNSHPYTSSNLHSNNSFSDITLFNSHIAARQAISKDLPIFSGKPEEWPIFITNYMESTERCGFTDQENLIRLQKSLKGAALDAVRGKLMMPRTVNLAIETLRMLYGRPEIIHQALQKNLKNEPIVRRERLETLINFALAVQNYSTTMQAMGLINYLNDPMLLNELVDKLPADLRLDWGRYRRTLQHVDVMCFDSWLYNLATCASEVTPYSPYTGELKNSKKERILIHDVINKEKPQQHLCFKCKNNHRLFECSGFKALNVNDRWQFIRSNNLCLRCFKKHNFKKCLSKRQCGVDNCKMPHNSLLHKINNEDRREETEGNDNQNQSVLLHIQDKILFKYIPVTLSGVGFSLNTYALIDEGASCSLIESELADQLGLEGPTKELCLQWTNDITQKEEKSKSVSLWISARSDDTKMLLENVRTIKNLDLPVQSLTKTQIENSTHLKNLQILPYNNAKARILIGLDNAKLCVPLEIIENDDNELIASRCRIGWGVYGRKPTGNFEKQRVLHICPCTSNEIKMDEIMKQYFSLDSVGIKVNQNPLRSKDDERALTIMQKTTKYSKTKKRWETGLLWKFNEICLPNSFMMAKRRLFCLETKMQRDNDLKTFIVNKMRDYERKGYVRKLQPNEIRNDNKSWYIPIFTVKNKNKNKTRIVWDAAAAVENVSLNSVMLKGPDLLKSLVGVLIRFRERPFAICGDIREMFHQIEIRKEDQSYQQFLWRAGDSSKPIEIYVMCVMTFGASCSPSLANYIKNLNAERFLNYHPTAVQAILDNTFVDDWLQSVNTEDELAELANTVRFIHADGGFEMCNWLSNSKKALIELGTENSDAEKMFEDPEGKFEKVLGMWWKPLTDELTFFENFSEEMYNESTQPTKRMVLRVVMTIFDPLGLLGNFVINAKILLQDIWRSHVGWDEPIQNAEREKWFQWLSMLPKIPSIRIPRCFPLASKSTNLQLHIFVDASIDAYSAVAYLRAEYIGDIKCILIASKTRVAPLKPISVPKMELMAAILGLRLSKFIYEEVTLKFNRRVFWADSKDVLYWIRSDARKFQQFVAVRIGEILEESDVSEWRWVPSTQNVADEGTKWSCNPDLSNDSRWFNGPTFLYNDETLWPISEFTDYKAAEMEVVQHISEKPKFIYAYIIPDISRFSKWERLLGCQLKILKFIHKYFKIEKANYEFKLFSKSSLADAASSLLYLICQDEAYYDEIKILKNNESLNKNHALYKITPYVDNFGVLRIKGRIDAAKTIAASVKRPIILPQKHYITHLIVDFYHRKYHHQHNEIVVNEIRQVFWVFGLRAVVRGVSKNCQYCKNRRAAPKVPVMGDLPAERLSTFTRPFYYTGVDYFGPIDIVVGRRKEKRWGVVFTCMTVRAVHLEIASSLSTDSFLLVLKQFICRRGAPRKIMSDNATNFRGASRVLKEEVEKISSSRLEREFPTIEWSFLPPSSPHMGGTWERMVRSVKSVLMEILPNRGLREESLRAALADVENILNSRPLTYVPMESSESEALTPNHFLIGCSSGIREVDDPQSSGLVLSKNFRISNMIANEFWKRWIREYLPNLTRRTKWYDSSIKSIEVDDVVVIVDENAKRNEWLKGVVVDVHRGKDNSVRSAVVKTKSGLSTKPVAKIAKLDVKK